MGVVNSLGPRLRQSFARVGELLQLPRLYAGLKMGLAHARPWLEPVGAFASVIIAVLAFMIQQELARQAEKRAAVERSIALYQDFMNDDAIKALMQEKHRIESAIWYYEDKDVVSLSDGESTLSLEELKDEGDKYRARNAFLVRAYTKPRTDEFRGWVIALLHHVDVLYECGGYADDYEEKELSEDESVSADLCDQKTIYTLMRGPLLDLFSTYKTLFYCDRYVASRYFAGGHRNDDTSEVAPAADLIAAPVGRYESLFIDFVKRDWELHPIFRTWLVYRTTADRDEAISKDASIKMRSIFARLPRCQLVIPLKNPMETVQSTAAPATGSDTAQAQ